MGRHLESDEVRFDQVHDKEQWSVSPEWLVVPVPVTISDIGPQHGSRTDRFIAFSRFTGAIHVLDTAVVEMLANVHGTNRPADQSLQALRELGLMVAPHEKRRVTVHAGHRGEIWVKINDTCQLACPQCFDGQAQLSMNSGINRSDRVMSEKTIEGVIRNSTKWAIDQDYTEIHYKIAGGEPSLSKEQVLRFVRQAQSIAPDGIRPTFSLVTNGIGLTSAFINELKSLGVHVAISIDGIADDHNKIRIFRGGRGSFDQVYQALGMLKASEISHNVSTVINRHNIGNLWQLFQRIYNEYGWTVFSLTFVRDNPAATENVTPSNDHLIAGLRRVYAQVAQRAIQDGRAIQREGLLDYVLLDAARSHVCGAGRNYAVFDSQGRLSSCHVLANDKPVMIGAYENISQIIRDAHPVPIALRDVDNTTGSCFSCNNRYQCAGGGCKLHQHHVYGSYDSAEPVYCQTYKTMTTEWLKMKVFVEVNNGLRPVLTVDKLSQGLYSEETR